MKTAIYQAMLEIAGTESLLTGVNRIGESAEQGRLIRAFVHLDI